MIHHVMLDFNNLQTRSGQMLTENKYSILWSIHLNLASIQQSLPVTDKSWAIFRMQINSEGCFISIPVNFLSPFIVSCAK